METQSKKQVVTPKVLSTQYVVKVNGEVYKELSPDETLKFAREIVRSINVTDATKIVEIVRRNVTETVINTFEPKATVSLVAVDDLGLD